MSTKTSVFIASFSACASVAALLGACATDGETRPEDKPPPSTIPEPTADGGADATTAEADAGACADCDYFPETCTPEVLCPNGPFDPKGLGAGLSPMAQINVIRGRSTNDVWVAGAMGALAHFDGTSWAVSDPGAKETLRALLLRDSGEIVFGEVAKIFTRGLPVDDGGTPSAGGWVVRDRSSIDFEYDPESLKLTAAWASPDSEWIWCATTAKRPGMANGLWRLRVSPSAPPEVTAALPPGRCSEIPCSQMLALHGAAADSLWAVGMGGAAVRVTGAESDTPTVTPFNTQTLNALQGVWTASDTEAWAVGTQGTIRHYAGDPVSWEVSNAPTKVDLFSVWGSSGSDVWAVGDDAVVLHYDGTSWSRVKVAGLGPRRPKLTAVWLAAPGHVVVGGEGVILSLGGKP